MVQIKSTLANLFVILLIAPALGVGMAYLNGELHGWTDLGKALDHGFFVAVCMAFAWLGMASPLAKNLKSLMSTVRTPDGREQTTELSLNTGSDSKPVVASVNPTTGVVKLEEKAAVVVAASEPQSPPNPPAV